MELWLVVAFVCATGAGAGAWAGAEVAPDTDTAAGTMFYHRDIGIPAASLIRMRESLPTPPTKAAGGEPSKVGRYPYAGGLVIEVGKETSQCGASLLSRTRALTAAHCWFDGQQRASKLTLVLGSEHLFSGGTRVESDHVQMHNDWDPKTHRNDIAVIIVNRVEYTDNIKPIPFATGSDHHAGSSAVLVGYGQTGEVDTNKDRFLHHVNLLVIPNAECKKLSATGIVESMLCTSGTGGVGTCPGDSGAPLATGTGDSRKLIGVTVTPYGDPNSCIRGHPSVFTRVSTYAEWIQELL